MTRTPKVVTATATVLLAFSLAACSDDSDNPTDPTGSSSESSSTSQSTSAAPKDRSDEVFGAYERPDVLGSTSGKVALGVGGGDPELGGEKVTFEVTGVTASEDATVVRYQVVADKEIDFRMRGEFWYQQPSLRVPGSDVRLQSVTATLPEYDGESGEICACTAVYGAQEEPQPQSVVYPPLPDDAKKVEVILQELDPVTVPVTR